MNRFFQVGRTLRVNREMARMQDRMLHPSARRDASPYQETMAKGFLASEWIGNARKVA